MLLNSVEKAMLNNPLRASLQRRFEAPRLLSMGGRMSGGLALEVGCGRGVGTQLIFDYFGADRVDAFDLDPDMLRRASRRLARYSDRVRLTIGDVTAIQAENATYDAVFDFAVVHHVPAWLDALREIHRVLKPGGRFYAEEVLVKFIQSPLSRRLFDHPLEDRFDHERFCDGLEEAGLRIVATRQIWEQVGWFVAEKPY